MLSRFLNVLFDLNIALMATVLSVGWLWAHDWLKLGAPLLALGLLAWLAFRFARPRSGGDHRVPVALPPWTAAHFAADAALLAVAGWIASHLPPTPGWPSAQQTMALALAWCGVPASQLTVRLVARRRDTPLPWRAAFLGSLALAGGLQLLAAAVLRG